MKPTPTVYSEVHTESNMTSPRVTNPQDGDQAYAMFGNNNWTTVVYVHPIGWLNPADARKLQNAKVESG